MCMIFDERWKKDAVKGRVAPCRGLGGKAPEWGLGRSPKVLPQGAAFAPGGLICVSGGLGAQPLRPLCFWGVGRTKLEKRLTFPLERRIIISPS